MNSLQDLLIEDIFTKVCPPSKVLMLRRISKTFKDAIDDMRIGGQTVQSNKTLESAHRLTVHLKIYGSRIDNIYNNLKNLNKNYIITKIEFIRYNMFMFIDLDKISILCPSLTHLDLGPYDFNFESLNNFQKNMPKCKIYIL
jgi:hypothetical protein